GSDDANRRPAACRPQPACTARGVAGDLRLARGPAARAAGPPAPCSQTPPALQGTPAAVGTLPLAPPWDGPRAGLPRRAAQQLQSTSPTAPAHARQYRANTMKSVPLARISRLKP